MYLNKIFFQFRRQKILIFFGQNREISARVLRRSGWVWSIDCLSCHFIRNIRFLFTKQTRHHTVAAFIQDRLVILQFFFQICSASQKDYFCTSKSNWKVKSNWFFLRMMKNKRKYPQFYKLFPNEKAKERKNEKNHLVLNPFLVRFRFKKNIFYDY